MNVEKNEFFKEVTLRICGSLDIDLALKQSFEYIKQFIPAETIGLGFSDLASERIYVVAKTAQENASYIWIGGSLEIVLTEEDLNYVHTKPTDQPLVTVINRPDGQPDEMLHMFPGLYTHSALFLRLEIQREEIGALLISAKGLDRYTLKDSELIESVREPFTIAMLNARRYKELVRLKDQLVEDNRALSADLKRSVGVEVVGADFGLREVMEQVRQIAPSNSSALLLGETGTGKEVIAHAIHMASPRRKRPMISMQCGAIPDTLLDSELFGHEKGAFTGATERKRGRFERAHGGTLFLDEIGELSPEAQVKLLRVLQEHCLERLGGIQTVEVDVRVIAATHRDLGKMVRQGTFREDLWYRLNVLPIHIPPLRLRREDIPSLVQYFVERKAQEMNILPPPRINRHDLEQLQAYDWPGNVRELQNIVERSLIISQGGILQFPNLSPNHFFHRAQITSTSFKPPRTMDEAIADHIHSVLDQVDWQVAGPGGAAEILRMNPSTLRFRMKKLGIQRKRKQS